MSNFAGLNKFVTLQKNIYMIVTARIDTTKSMGLKTVRELEGKKFAKLEYPKIEGITTHRLEDVIERGWEKLSAHYGVDMKALAKSKGYI